MEVYKASLFQKSQKLEKIFLLDDSNRLIDDENTIAEILNDYFENVTSTVNLKASESCHTHSSETNLQNHFSVRILQNHTLLVNLSHLEKWVLISFIAPSVNSIRTKL